MELIKAISFKLLDVTTVKLNRLQAISDKFKEVYNFTTMRLPSFQELRQSKSRMAIEAIRKDVKSELHSQVTQEAIEYARSNYLTAIQNDGDSPKLSANIIRFHNQCWEFKYKNDRCYLVVPLERIGKNKYNKMWLPIKTNNYLNHLIISTKFGVGQINIDKQTFTTSYKVEHEPKKYTPEHFIGIDLGINNIAVLVVTNADKQILETKFWNGNQIRHIRKQFYEYRKSVQTIGRMDCTKKSKGYESNWMKNINHNISREIIEIAKKYQNPVIHMEDLHRFKRGKIQWNFFQLREMIRYKAEYENIMFNLVDPKNTSLQCNKCGHVDKENRTNHLFKCMSCGYSVNADFNAAVNISRLIK